MQHTPSTDVSKLYVIAAGSQGGVGKTTVMVELAAYCQKQGIPTTKIDLDESVKKIGNFSGFFSDAIQSPLDGPVGFDTLLKAVDMGPRVILVDSPASTTKTTLAWIKQYHSVLHKRGHSFLVVGVITPEPSSASGFLSFSAALQHLVKYLIVKNQTQSDATVSAWDTNSKVPEFMESFNPNVIEMPHRHRDLQKFLRQHSLTVSQVVSGEFRSILDAKAEAEVRAAAEKAGKPMQEPGTVVRPLNVDEGMFQLLAESVDERSAAAFDQIKDVLLGIQPQNVSGEVVE